MAGVSVATVSRVLNDSGNVRQDTVDQVNAAIEQLDYHPNFLGRTLRRLETMKILVLVPTISNQLYSRVIKGIRAVAQANGYHLMLAISDEGEEEYINMLRRKLVDGMIFLYSKMTAEEMGKLASEYPVVMACEYLRGAKAAAVSIDDYRASYDATRFLIERGNKRIGFISAGELYASSVDRQKGYRDALTANGLKLEPELIIDEGLTFNAGRRAAQRILAMKHRPDAVFAVADSTAIGLISRLTEEHIRIPDDLSVMGFDNNQISEFYIPPLTTVSQPQFEIGQRAMDLLLERIKSPCVQTEHIVLPHQLVIRKSVR